jgi:hypothetical protein
MKFKCQIIVETTVEVDAKSKEDAEDKVSELLSNSLDHYIVTFEAIYKSED